ncbi:MAG: 1-deoxy-D-xylulose-5-phosphate reductoisomerase [Victivallaceae bacterium]|nr:1-deoxy-D-xylulose-5-phosphate reductoisomerase [Victivallaceae bacterium]
MDPISPRRVAVLGATGSIGRSAAAELAEHSAEFQVVALAARHQLDELARQSLLFHPDVVITTDPALEKELARKLPPGVRAASGEDAMVEVAMRDDVDILLCAVIGTAGIRPVLEALKRGKRVALASKEVLALAGELVMAEAKKHPGCLVPIDSEHSGVFQALAGRRPDEIAKVWLTASGGAFRDWDPAKLEKATFADALRHPTWKMGDKITVDSASLMNKALEVIEAHFLFDLPSEKLDVVINPQSVVHALAELTDGSFIAQMSVPDMKLAIRYALSWPERLPGSVGKSTLPALGKLEFKEVDHQHFPAIALARKAIEASGTMPAVLNAADEVAVARFRQGEIKFTDIWKLVGDVMAAIPVEPQHDLEQILDCDRRAREAARAWHPAE